MRALPVINIRHRSIVHGRQDTRGASVIRTFNAKDLCTTRKDIVIGHGPGKTGGRPGSCVLSAVGKNPDFVVARCQDFDTLNHKNQI